MIRRAAPVRMIPMLVVCSLSFAMPAAAVSSAPAQTRAECGDWQDCRDKAIAAREQGDFELLHDLAWRAVQKGPRNDAALLTLLARAQSLSGRPHDALVMLQRLAAMGVVTDAAESDDFRRVRALPAWAAFQNARAATTLSAERAAPTGSAFTPASTRPAPGTPVPPGTPPGDPAARASTATPGPGKPIEAPVAGEAADAVRFITVPFTPAGLAYDAVSNRFILGDRVERKLSVIGERSQRLVNLAGEESAGFGEIRSIAIDARQGDLWVASTTDDGAPVSKLHKLQLISGRLLMTATFDDGGTPARITDLAVAPDGAMMALDGPGHRLFRLGPRAKEAEAIATLDVADAVSIAPAPGNIVYVASPGGLARVDIAARRSRAVRAAGPIGLEGLSWIRWHRGALVGVQKSGEGLHRIVRIRIDSAGRTVTRIDLLEKDVALADPSTVAVTDDGIFYLARQTGYSASGGMEITIRRVRLKPEAP
jgi:hypothetical protein